MVVYGMLYKRGHKRKNWQMRLFVLDGSTCKYYELGNTEVKGSFDLAQVRGRHFVLSMRMVQRCCSDGLLCVCGPIDCEH